MTRHLKSDVLPVCDLSEERARGLFALFSRHYDGVSWETFEADLREKDRVIVLRDAATGALGGFSTLKLLSARVRGKAIRAVFSGDTVIDPAYWGEQELVRAFCREAGRVWAEDPLTRLFWLLICKGYRTYLYLPLFYRSYLPQHGKAPGDFEGAVLSALAAAKFPESWRPETGTLEFPEPRGRLSSALAGIPESRRDDPRVKFFLESNPNYRAGSELVCLTELCESNMRGLAGRMFREGAGIEVGAPVEVPA